MQFIGNEGNLKPASASEATFGSWVWPICCRNFFQWRWRVFDF